MKTIKLWNYPFWTALYRTYRINDLPFRHRFYKGVKLLRDLNISQRLQEPIQWYRYGDRHFPRSVSIEVSAFCNRTCSYCPNHFTPRAPVDYMPMDRFELVLKRLADARWVGPVSYAFLGEPLLDKRLPELIRLTKKILPRSLPRIYTNGDFLTEPLLKELIASGVFNLVVVRHPPFSDEWDRRVIPLIANPLYRHLFTYNGSLKLRFTGDPVPVADSTHYIQTHPFGGGNTSPDIVYKECPHIRGNYTILRNLDVVQCCLSWDRAPVMGNLATEGVLEIWNKPIFREIRDDVMYKKIKTPKMDKCKACFGVLKTPITKENAMGYMNTTFWDLQPGVKP